MLPTPTRTSAWQDAGAPLWEASRPGSPREALQRSHTQERTEESTNEHQPQCEPKAQGHRRPGPWQLERPSLGALRLGDHSSILPGRAGLKVTAKDPTLGEASRMNWTGSRLLQVKGVPGAPQSSGSVTLQVLTSCAAPARWPVVTARGIPQ